MYRKKTGNKNKKVEQLIDQITPMLVAWSSYGLIIVGVLLLLSLVKNVSTINSADATIAETKMRLEKLQRENAELEGRVAEVQSPSYKEIQGRDKLGLAKPGETVLVLPQEDVLRRVSPVEDVVETNELPLPNWQKWLKLFL